MATTLQVRRDRLAETKTVAAGDTPLAPGQVRARIDAFALTANNITYAAFGDSMDYWKFFPSGEEGWGIVPAWGFASIVQSLHPGVAVGERLYGYWPMADSVVLQPDRLAAGRFMDATPHRAALHAVYNQYLRTASDPFYTPPTEAVQALMRPLFSTSWLLDDFLAERAFFDTGTIVLSSASSKTAYATAFLLSQRSGVQVLGLTSEKNRAFCEGLGCYTRVLAYESVETIAADTPCVYVDFSGDAPLRERLEAHLRALKSTWSVGGTHVQALGEPKDFRGGEPGVFFAPAQAKKRVQDWGPAAFQQKMLDAWAGFLAKATDKRSPWVVVREHRGPQAVQRAFADMLAGRSEPREGHILSMR